MDKDLFKKRLIELRGERSRHSVAKDLFLKDQTLEKYEKGDTLPNIEKAAEIAQYFGVSTDYLLGLSDVQSPDTDIQAICKYTGLSEKALNSILLFKKCQTLDKEYDNKRHSERFPNYEYTDTISLIISDFYYNPDIIFSLTGALNYDCKELEFHENDDELNVNEKFKQLYPNAYEWAKDKMVLYSKHDNYNFIKSRMEYIFEKLASRILSRFNPNDPLKGLYGNEHFNIEHYVNEYYHHIKETPRPNDEHSDGE